MAPMMNRRVMLTSHKASNDTNVLSDFVRTNQSKTAAFERLLVRNQLYDVLAYAHRSHGPPPSMLFELRKAAIVS